MSVIPKKGEKLELFEGSTFDETWEFLDDDDEPINLTGWSAELKVRATYESAVILACASGALVVAPTANAIDLTTAGATGLIRVYVGSTPMAALNSSQFTSVSQEDGSTTYEGVWDIELINPGGERFRYIMGPAVFSPEVTY